MNTQKTNEKQGINQAIKLIWKLTEKKEKVLLILYLFLSLIRAVNALFPPLITACIVQKLSGETAYFLFFKIPNEYSNIVTVLICIVTYFFILVFSTMLRSLIKLLSTKIMTEINTKSSETILKARKNTEINFTAGEITYILKNASESVQAFIEQILVDVASPTLSSLIAIIYLSITNILTLPIIIVTIFIISIFIKYRLKKDSIVYKNMEIINGKTNNNVLNSINNLSFINFFKTEKFETERIENLNLEYYSFEKKRIKTYRIYWLTVYTIEFLCLIFCVYLVLISHQPTTIIISNMIIVIPYLLKIFNSVESFGFLLGKLQQYGIKICRLNLIFPKKEELLKMETKNKLPKRLKITKIECKDIRLKIKKFEKSYKNIVFENNGLNCIIGKSGTGKSSLINSLLGLKEKQNGYFVVNDKYKIDSFFENNDKIALAIQDEVFFDRPIIENIMYPEIELNRKSKRLVKLFNIEKLITRKDFDISNTQNTTFKQSFSGGEKRRFNIIRCLTKKTDVYILDEPTNDLDKKNVENLIHELTNLAKKHIVIVITHDTRIIDISKNIINL